MQLRTQQWAVIDGAVGQAAAAHLRQEIFDLREVRSCMRYDVARKLSSAVVAACTHVSFGYSRMVRCPPIWRVGRCSVELGCKFLHESMAASCSCSPS